MPTHSVGGTSWSCLQAHPPRQPCSRGLLLLWCHLLLRGLLHVMWCLPVLPMHPFSSLIPMVSPGFPLLWDFHTLFKVVLLPPQPKGRGMEKSSVWSFFLIISVCYLEHFSCFLDLPWVVISKALGIVLLMLGKQKAINNRPIILSPINRKTNSSTISSPTNRHFSTFPFCNFILCKWLF